MLISVNIWIALSKQSDFAINHDFLGLGKHPNFGPNLHDVSYQYLKLEIESTAEKSSAYATILASEFLFVLVISNTINMSSMTNNV